MADPGSGAGGGEAGGGEAGEGEAPAAAQAGDLADYWSMVPREVIGRIIVKVWDDKTVEAVCATAAKRGDVATLDWLFNAAGVQHFGPGCLDPEAPSDEWEDEYQASSRRAELWHSTLSEHAMEYGQCEVFKWLSMKGFYMYGRDDPFRSFAEIAASKGAHDILHVSLGWGGCSKPLRGLTAIIAVHAELLTSFVSVIHDARLRRP